MAALSRSCKRYAFARSLYLESTCTSMRASYFALIFLAAWRRFLSKQKEKVFSVATDATLQPRNTSFEHLCPSFCHCRSNAIRSTCIAPSCAGHMPASGKRPSLSPFSTPSLCPPFPLHPSSFLGSPFYSFAFISFPAAPAPPHFPRYNIQKKRESKIPAFGFRQRPNLPGRVQPSTFGAKRLNCCVRNGNRWNPLAIATGNGLLSFRARSASSLPPPSRGFRFPRALPRTFKTTQRFPPGDLRLTLTCLPVLPLASFSLS